MPDANTKYSSAWNEINARIQARDRVLLTFISLTAVLVGIALSKDELAFTAIGVGYLAFATSLIILQHDLVIYYLATFQREIAEKDGIDDNTPDWMSEKYINMRLPARYIRNLAHFLFILFGGVPSLYIARTSLNAALDIRTFIWFGSLLFSAGAAFVVMYITYNRMKLTKLKPLKDTKAKDVH